MKLIDEVGFNVLLGVCTDRNSEYEIKIFERKGGEEEVK